MATGKFAGYTQGAERRAARQAAKAGTKPKMFGGSMTPQTGGGTPVATAGPKPWADLTAQRKALGAQMDASQDPAQIAALKQQRQGLAGQIQGMRGGPNPNRIMPALPQTGGGYQAKYSPGFPVNNPQQGGVPLPGGNPPLPAPGGLPPLWGGDNPWGGSDVPPPGWTPQVGGGGMPLQPQLGTQPEMNPLAALMGANPMLGGVPSAQQGMLAMLLGRGGYNGQ